MVARTISNGHAQALDLSTSDREAFHRATEKLAPLGVTLDEAIREYIEAKLLLKGQPLTPAADTYARLYNGVVTGAKVRTVAEEFLKAKREYGLSKRYLKQLDSDLNRFGRGFPGEISSITAGDMDRWLRSLKVSNRSRNNMLTSLRTLSHFAQKRGYPCVLASTIGSAILAPDQQVSGIGEFQTDAIRKFSGARGQGL